MRRPAMPSPSLATAASSDRLILCGPDGDASFIHIEVLPVFMA
jgi:hypothetical protein